jgi:hypothetical protein
MGLRRNRRETILVSWKPMPPTLRDDPKVDEAALHESLLTWADWCHTRRRAGRCLSAEGQYVRETTRAPSKPIAKSDAIAAEKINSALLLIPVHERSALQMRYFQLIPDRIIARKLKLNTEAYPVFMRRARLMLKNVLRLAENGPILRSDNSLPSSDETSDAQKQGIASSPKQHRSLPSPSPKAASGS